MRTIVWIVIAQVLLAGAALAEDDPAALFDRGVSQFRAGAFEAAARDLDAATQAYLSPAQMEAYVNTGRLENLDRIETALVYLSLAYARLGREEEARQAILRLLAAERIEATYTRLPLGGDAAEFETLARRLLPEVPLTANTQLAGVTPAAAPQTTASSAPPATPPATTSVEDRRKLVDDVIAAERARIAREAEERIEGIRREAEAAVAAARRAAEEEVAAAQRAADERVERLRRELESQYGTAAADPEADDRAAAADSVTRRGFLVSLREAEELIGRGRTSEANRIYVGLAEASTAPREVIAEAATGLYRTRAYREAARAFSRLGTFQRGEEDLRFYNAVVLFEAGSYADAQHELSCALPYIQVTDEVTRYRAKIEGAQR